MKTFLKENAVLVLGVLLPVLLIAAFMVAQSVSKLLNDPPRYPVLFHRTGIQFFQASIDDERLKVTFSRPLHLHDEAFARLRPQQKTLTLYLFDPRENKLERYKLAAPDRIAEGATAEVNIPDKLASMRFDDSLESPDGFRLIRRTRRGGSFFNELFTGRHYGQVTVLKNNGFTYRVRDHDGYYQADQFLGWAVHHDAD